ncbi:hypothetical protein [Streptomyces bluensis]|uniref:hypothetical protein n=1 Tax=Streptomyces bluensis TaxID=33897 RepID=UPI00332D70D2
MTSTRERAVTEQAQAVASTTRLIAATLDELMNSSDRGDALREAGIAALEAALLIATASDRARQDRSGGQEAIRLAREALASARAAVVATTCAVRALHSAGRHDAAPPVPPS